MDLDKLLGDDSEVKEEKPVATTNEKPKRKGKPRGGNNWLSPENQTKGLQPGDNTKYLTMSMTLASLPPIDLHDGEAVEERIMQYFSLHAEQDMKPTVAGLGIALGMDRRRLWEIKTGTNVGSSGKPMDLPPRVVDAIKKAYFLMENQWEQYMLNGKVNPVTGIFLGKNNFGYQDKTEYVLTPNQQNDNDYDADAIRERYMAADQQKRLSDTSSDEEPNEE